MSQSIDVSFVKQFESEVHLAYQRMGTKMRNTVRTKSNVKGADTTFQKIGKGTAGTKTRHGNVPVMTLDHTKVTITLADYYAADYVDKLDELKINHDERGAVVQSAAGALGRKSDELLITALGTTTNSITEAGSVGITQAKVNTVFNAFGNSDIPDDGRRYWVIGPRQWTDMLAIQAFSDADYVGSDDLPYKGGMVARRWMGFMWFTHSGLDIASSKRTTLAYHSDSGAFASGADVQSQWDWIPEKAAYFYNAYMSQGAGLIDATGVYKVQAAE